MEIETFLLERTQSLYENEVEYNLTESGVHPYTLNQLLSPEALDSLLNTRLGYGYTNGDPETRQAVANLYPGDAIENALITNGSAEANFILCWSVLEPGDELILMQPNYMQMWGIARSFGATVKPFFLKEENAWAPDLDELASLMTPRTKMISICNPNNPTGAVLSESDMRGIVDIAGNAGVLLHCDEIYRGSELDGIERPSFRHLYDKAVITAGLSKSMANPGLRIGWVSGPSDIIDQCWHHKDYTSITTCILSERVAAIALKPEKRAEILGRSRNMLNTNLALLEEWISKRSNLFRFVPPRAGGMAFLRYNLDMNSTKLSDGLRQEKSVFIVAGDCYGMDGYVRIGIGSEKEYLYTGLDRLSDYLKSLS